MKKLERELSVLIAKYGRKSLEDSFRSSESEEGAELTIIVNEGTHHVPTDYLRGEVFVFSRGSFSTAARGFELALKSRLRALAKILKSRRWKSVYIVPTGHPVLSMNVMLMVFRVTRLEASIVGYFGDAGYKIIQVAQRPILDGMLGRTKRPMR